MKYLELYKEDFTEEKWQYILEELGLKDDVEEIGLDIIKIKTD